MSVPRSNPDFADGGPTAHYKHRLLLMLDEFPALGRLDFLQTALGYLAGYGVKAYLIAQDLAQIYQRYTTHESIVSGCTVRIAYAPNKPETARLLSDMAGQMTVFRETRTYTGSRLQPVLMHVIAAESETKRPLLTPDEVMRLPADDALIFAAGHPPIYGRKIRYYEDPVFSRRAKIPPPERSDALPVDASDWPAGEDDDGDGPVPEDTPPVPDPDEFPF